MDSLNIYMNSLKESFSLRFFARPSFVEGMGRVLDMGDTMDVYNESRSRSGAEADAAAMAEDWRMVGRDIRQAIEYYEPRSTKQRD